MLQVPNLVKSDLVFNERLTEFSVDIYNKPVNEPVYQFLDRKRAEGKPYLVYMTAGANKFLRIYYGKVKECLRNLEQSQIEES